MQIIIAGKYKLQKKINQGAFGQVYLAINTKNGQELGVKFEPLNCKHPQLLVQAKIIKSILNENTVTDKGIPNVYYTGIQGQFNVMVMDYLGPNLQYLLHKCNDRLSLKSTMMVADQMLKRIQFVHTKNFLHRDIKPDNFLMGVGKKNKKLYLIDFGLSKKYIKDGQHIKYNDNKSMVGTVRYASVNTHLGIQPTRRDDLQSFFFCIVYLYKGSLPWQGLKAPNAKQKYEKILQKKIEYRPQLLCKQLPTAFRTIIEHIRSLKFDHKPNYQLLKNSIKECLKDFQLEYDYYFDWNKLDDEKNKFQK